MSSFALLGSHPARGLDSQTTGNLPACSIFCFHSSCNILLSAIPVEGGPCAQNKGQAASLFTQHQPLFKVTLKRERDTITLSRNSRC